LRSGDIVLAYDGEELQLSSGLPPMVGRTPIGESARLTVLRGGNEMFIDVKIGQLPDERGAQAQSPATPDNSISLLFGLSVEPLPASMTDAQGVSAGVLVADVQGGPAFDAGIRPNDVITEIDRKAVTSVADFRNIAGNLAGDRAVPVRIVRQGRALYLVMKP
jgi:serine protease Do